MQMFVYSPECRQRRSGDQTLLKSVKANSQSQHGILDKCFHFSLWSLTAWAEASSALPFKLDPCDSSDPFGPFFKAQGKHHAEM